jgi:hypothetical protein
MWFESYIKSLGNFELKPMEAMISLDSRHLLLQVNSKELMSTYVTVTNINRRMKGEHETKGYLTMDSIVKDKIYSPLISLLSFSEDLVDGNGITSLKLYDSEHMVHLWKKRLNYISLSHFY